MAAVAVRAAFLPSLETFTILLQTTTLHTIASDLLTLGAKEGGPSGLTVPAAITQAVLAACLAGSIALTVFGLAEGFDAAAPEPSSGGNFVEQIVDLAISWIDRLILKKVILIEPS